MPTRRIDRFRTRALVFGALAAMAALAPSVAAGEIVQPAAGVDIRAACGAIAVNGDVVNSSISGGCGLEAGGQIGEAISLLRSLAAERDVDPELVQMVGKGAYGRALARLEALAQTDKGGGSRYLSAASAIELMRGRLPSASEYARRAFEAAPNDAVLMIKYHGLLGLTGRPQDASKLLDMSFRRRAQFGQVGNLYVEVMALDREYPLPIFLRWADETKLCWDGILGLEEYSERLKRPIGSCALRGATAEQAKRLREKADRLASRLDRVAFPNATTRNMRYILLNYVLASDYLLDPKAEPGSSAMAVDKAGADIFQSGGPWAALGAASSTSFADLILPEPLISSRTGWFEQALEDASAVPATSYDETDLSTRVLAPSARLAIGYYRYQRATIYSLRDEHQQVLRQGRLALRELSVSRPVGSAAPTAILTINLLLESAQQLGPANPAFDVTSEYRALEAAALKDIDGVAPYSQAMLSTRYLACRARILQPAVCRSKSLEKAFAARAREQTRRTNQPSSSRKPQS